MGKADLVLKRAHLISFSGDAFSDRYDSVAVKRGLIQAIGYWKDVESLVGPDTRVYDLEGATLLPGFIDTHVHLTQTGMQMIGIDLVKARSIEELLSILKCKAAETEDEFVIAFFDEMNLKEKTFPALKQLDEAVPDKFLRISQLSGHLSLTNSVTFRWLGLDPSTPGIGRDSDGNFNGVLTKEANHTFARTSNEKLVSDKQRERGIKLVIDECLRRGVTTIHALEGGAFFGDADSDFVFKSGSGFKVDVLLWDQTMDIERVKSRGLQRIGGCITADGAIEAYTAATFSEYPAKGHRGALYFSDEEIEQFVKCAHDAGLQIAIHCDGDRAVEQVLIAYEKALRDNPRYDHRHRIEHAEIITHEQVERIARLGIYVAMQPSHLRSFGDKYEEHLGRETMNRVHLYKTMTRAGILIGGGSDAFVSPINPLFDIQSAVNHRNLPTESLSVYEAMRLFTINAAKFGFEERHKGSIEVGKRADLVVLERDPREVGVSEIQDIRILKTFVKGVEEYSA